jgi:hypothetical protein
MTDYQSNKTSMRAPLDAPWSIHSLAAGDTRGVCSRPPSDLFLVGFNTKGRQMETPFGFE